MFTAGTASLSSKNLLWKRHGLGVCCYSSSDWLRQDVCRVSGIHCAGSSCAHEGKKAKSTLFAFRVLPSVWQSQLCCLSLGSWPSGVEEQKIQTQQLHLCRSNWVLSSKPFSEKNYDRYICVPIASGNQITTPSGNMFVVTFVPLFPQFLLHIFLLISAFPSPLLPTDQSLATDREVVIAKNHCFGNPDAMFDNRGIKSNCRRLFWYVI